MRTDTNGRNCGWRFCFFSRVRVDDSKGERRMDQSDTILVFFACFGHRGPFQSGQYEWQTFIVFFVMVKKSERFEEGRHNQQRSLVNVPR